jgi:hypothetical protein
MTELGERFLAALVVLALGAVAVTISYVFVVYVIQGKPTQRQKDRTHIKQLQIQVNQLDTRVKILEAK